MDQYRQQDDARPDEALSPRARHAFKQLGERPLLVPAEDKAAMQAAIDEHFAQTASTVPARPQRRARWIGIGTAAAACIGLVVTAVVMTTQPQSHAPVSTNQTRQQAADVDGNGSVDIVDALQLARGLQTGRVIQFTDLTGDGIVDAADVDAIAAMAVSLDEKEQTAG